MPKKILLADDSITIQKVVELTFSDGDYEVSAVNNGAKAIQKLSELRPDIILSDIIMPEKNGYEVCEYVKSHPEFRTIPVVLLTGTFEPFDPDRADKAGCDAVVTKPFESQSLIHKVEELIENARSEAKTQPPSPSPFAPGSSPFSGMMTLPNTSFSLEHTALQGGFDPGTWSFKVNDFALECLSVNGCSPKTPPTNAYDIRVLLKTHNSRIWGSPEFHADFIGVTGAAAQHFVDRGVKLLGIDYLSIGDAEAHVALLVRGVGVVEGLDLRGVEPGAYFLACLPLKIAGCDGAPARAVLWPVHP